MEDMTGQGMAQVCKSEGHGKPFFFFLQDKNWRVVHNLACKAFLVLRGPKRAD